MMGLRNTTKKLIIKRVSLALLFCLFTTLAFAATVIKGRVVDSKTSKPILNADVRLVSLFGKVKASALTNANGNYEMKGLSFPKYGSLYYLKVSKDAYISIKDSIKLFKNNKTYPFDFRINPKIKILSISVNPKSWNIGSTKVNSVVTMTKGNNITIINNGSGSETMELKLINPNGWAASTSPGKETYVLSGLFCNSNDSPLASHFNQEDVITTQSRKAANTVFAYSQSTANGLAVPSGTTRALYLQFKSPTITRKKEEQEVSVIISCQIP